MSGECDGEVGGHGPYILISGLAKIAFQLLAEILLNGSGPYKLAKT